MKIWVFLAKDMKKTCNSLESQVFLMAEKEGFEKFISLNVQFNEHMNILVGENEAGKSTILDAIKTVLNQQYRNTDKSIL